MSRGDIILILALLLLLAIPALLIHYSEYKPPQFPCNKKNVEMIIKNYPHQNTVDVDLICKEKQ